MIYRPDKDGPETPVDERVDPPGHPIPHRGPARHPLPKWLGMERDFWQRYTGGVTEEVLDYLDEQGYPQERGGVEEVSGGRWTKGGDGVGKREETSSSVAQVKVGAAGDEKEQMREARAAHRARWRRERDERGKRRMTRVGGAAAAVAALALLALGTRRRTKRRDDE